MLAVFLTILISFLVTTLFGYAIHWSLHQTWAGQFNVAHMTHHLKLYPPEDFTSDVYRHAGKDSTPKFFAVAAIPLILTPILLWAFGVLALHLAVIVLVVEGTMGFLHDYIHDAFHINNHWMSRVPVLKDIFKKWVDIHYVHHVDMTKNYGIFTFLWDRLIGTYRIKA